MLFRKTLSLLFVFLLLGCVPATVPAPTPIPAGTEATATQTPAPTSTPTTPPTATPTVAPTDTPSPTPTVELTATPAEETSAASVNVTEEEYRNEQLGIVWRRPNDAWAIQDAAWLEGMMGEVTPLAILTPKEPADFRMITLASLDLPGGTGQIMAQAFETSPDLALESMAASMGDLGEDVELTEVAGEPAIFTVFRGELSEDTFTWIVIRPHGVLYIIGEGFDDVDTMETFLEDLEFMEPKLDERVPDDEAARAEMSRDAVVTAIEELRELDTLEPVSFEFMSREDLRARLNKRIEEELDRDELAAEEQMLKLLGLIPPDADLTSLWLDLHTSAVGGFYDEEEDVFYLIGEDTDMEQLDAREQIVFVHEYVHALQDQHFDLSRFTQAEDEAFTDDEDIAIKALVEGDAQWAETQYMVMRLGLDQLDQLMESDSELDYEVLERTPAFLRNSLIFPYIQGQVFIQNVFMTGQWSAVNDVWENLPASTEQIIHPEKYPDDAPTLVFLPENLAGGLGDGWSELSREVWGEAQLLLMLEEAIGASALTGADGWDGDQYAFLSNGEQHLLVMEIVWDDESEAMEGSDALTEWMAHRELEPETDNRFAGEDLGAYLQVTGDRLFFALTDEQAILDETIEVLDWEKGGQ